MTAPMPTRELATRQRRVRLAAGILIVGMLVQAQSFRAPGLSYFLTFALGGATLAVAGIACAVYALFRPVKPPAPTAEPPPVPASNEEVGPT